jgi:hypothetical protein
MKTTRPKPGSTQGIRRQASASQAPVLPDELVMGQRGFDNGRTIQTKMIIRGVALRRIALIRYFQISTYSRYFLFGGIYQSMANCSIVH